jgi:alkanesulfonate monooxygenase SsuD/methylene tetrahydromethanopterin reductase-like flavin-dependent oxidoreductase (luciferase family)
MLREMAGRGVALFAGTPAEVIAVVARSAEELGYASFWLNHAGSADGVAALSAAAHATSAIELGVGVVPLHTREASSVVAGVREHGLPTGRLLLGIGSANAGAFRLARDGAVLLRAELGCRVFMGALGEPACRLAGEIADGVLLNWLTPGHARRSVGWVAAGAQKAGRPRPPTYAYVRVALGPGARERIEAEGVRYQSGPYAPHFERMAAAPIETAIAAADADALVAGLRAWEGAIDQVVLRLLPAALTAEAHLEIIRAGAP